MLLDWFTIAAQIINFFILVWLLKKFLYGPITRAMHNRQQRLKENWDQAHARRERAEEREREAEKRKREIEDERREILDRAREKAQAIRDEAEKAAKDWTRNQRQEMHQRIERQKRELLGRLQTRFARQVARVSQKALADLSGDDLYERLAQTFLDRVQSRSEEVRAALSSTEITVEAGFEPDDELRELISKRLRELLGAETVRFRIVDTPMSLNLATRDKRFGWSLEEYLQGLTEQVLGNIEPTEKEGDNV